MDDSNPNLDEQDESVRIAVKALGDMRNVASRTLPPPPPSRDPSSDAFVARVAHLPFVNSALRVYEQGKASSRMVKYGAEMVESSVKTISRPVINRLPVDVNQLDEFACRQLDKLDRCRHPSPDSSNADPERRPKSKTTTLDGPALQDDDNSMQHEETSVRNGVPSSSEARKHHAVSGWLGGVNSPFSAPPLPPPDSRSSTPTQNADESRSDSRSPDRKDERQAAQRSRWQAVLSEAGGLSAALSEESMRRLKYCLHWLQYATGYIDAHILFLRNFTADLQPLSVSPTRRPPISEERMRRLIDVRRDIVHTIRQVVDIVSKYAGGALPEPAKTRVRGFILTLPQRWASKAGGTPGGGAGATGSSEQRDSTVTAAASGTGATRRPNSQRRAAHRERGPGGIEGGLRSAPASRASSPASPRFSRARSHLRHGGRGDAAEENGRVSAGTALLAAQRILVLATESLDMMRNVTSVMKDSLERAEAWVGRLQTVGIQRGTQQVEGADTSEFDLSHRSSRRDYHHNRSSAQIDEHDMPSSPLFSGSSSTTWGSSIPSTPGDAVYAGSPGAIAIGSMSLSSKYNTPRSGTLILPDEEEGEEGEGKREIDEE